MPDYQQGKIYKIVNRSSNDEKDCYVGSTCNSLSKRFSTHKKDWNAGRHPDMTIYQAFTNFGFNNFSIVLIENYPCNNKNELRSREEHHRLQIGANYNMNRAYATEQDHKDQDKAYREINKEAIAERGKVWRELNKEVIAAKSKEHYEQHQEEYAKKAHEKYLNNKDKILHKNREYRQNNKEKIAEERRARYLRNRERELQKCKEYAERNKEIVQQRHKQYRDSNRQKIHNYQNEKITCECGAIVSRCNKTKHLATKKHTQYIEIKKE